MKLRVSVPFVPWVLSFLCVHLLARAEEAWPQFRGPTGQGLSDATGLPLKWSETEHVKWKAPIHGKAWSSPVVLGNQIWLTTATEDGFELFAVAIDRTVLKDKAGEFEQLSVTDPLTGLLNRRYLEKRLVEEIRTVGEA